MTKMAPELPIEVDVETGVWTTDALPMLYVPRHFFINNHSAQKIRVYLIQFGLVSDLQSEDILYVKNVNCLFSERGDMSRAYLQTKRRKSSRQIIKQSWAVTTVDLDNGMRPAGIVIDQHPWRHFKDAHPAGQSGILL